MFYREFKLNYALSK